MRVELDLISPVMTQDERRKPRRVLYGYSGLSRDRVALVGLVGFPRAVFLLFICTRPGMSPNATPCDCGNVP